MSLTDYLSRAVSRTKVSFTRNKEDAVDYLMNHELKNYFSNVPEEERARLKSSLEEKIGTAIEKYDGELNGLIRKVGSKSSMGVAIANDIYGYITKAPFANINGLATLLLAGKTILEIPALYHYLKKSGDLYGGVSYMLLKPIRYLLPVVGPALESGAFERMVMRGVLKEAKYDFIKEFGEYTPAEERMRETLKMPIADATSKPMKAAA